MQAIPIIVFASVCLLIALLLPFFAEGTMPRSARVALHLSGVLIGAGVVVFVMPLIVNAGQFLPDSVEWPIGRTNDAVQTTSGTYVVSHNPSGRIQVYDQDLNFVTGWHVDSDGGTVRLVAPTDQDNVVDVYAVRLDQRTRYALDGTVLDQQPYTRSDFLQVEPGNVSLRVPPSWWQWPFTSPAWAVVLFMPGIIAQLVITRRHGVTLPFTPQHWNRV